MLGCVPPTPTLFSPWHKTAALDNLGSTTTKSSFPVLKDSLKMTFLAVLNRNEFSKILWVISDLQRIWPECIISLS